MKYISFLKKIIFLAIIIVTISSCSKPYIDIKSPCVSTFTETKKDPCGPRRPVNEWLFNKELS